MSSATLNFLEYLFQKLQGHTETFMHFTNYAQGSLSYIILLPSVFLL